LISWDLGVIHRHEREADLAAPPRPEGRNHRIQWRRDRLHGPKSIDHGRGARRPIGIPKRFTLTADGLRQPCHVIWRKEKRIGIAFD
jgi:hypothetical protein